MKYEDMLRKFDGLGVIYSAFRWADGHGDELIDNTMDVPVPGKVQVVADRNDYWGGADSQPFTSEVLLDPTWEDLMLVASYQIERTLDLRHPYLAGINVVIVFDDISICRLRMGA